MACTLRTTRGGGGAGRRAGEFPSESLHRSAGSVPSRVQFKPLSIALRAESGLSPLRVVCMADWADARSPPPPLARTHARRRRHRHHAPQSCGSWIAPSVKTTGASGTASAPRKARRTASTSSPFASSRTPLLGVDGSGRVTTWPEGEANSGSTPLTFPRLWTGCVVPLRAG